MGWNIDSIAWYFQGHRITDAPNPSFNGAIALLVLLEGREGLGRYVFIRRRTAWKSLINTQITTFSKLCIIRIKLHVIEKNPKYLAMLSCLYTDSYTFIINSSRSFLNVLLEVHSRCCRSKIETLKSLDMYIDASAVEWTLGIHTSFFGYLSEYLGNQWQSWLWDKLENLNSQEVTNYWIILSQLLVQGYLKESWLIFCLDRSRKPPLDFLSANIYDWTNYSLPHYPLVRTVDR